MPCRGCLAKRSDSTLGNIFPPIFAQPKLRRLAFEVLLRARPTPPDHYSYVASPRIRLASPAILALTLVGCKLYGAKEKLETRRRKADPSLRRPRTRTCARKSGLLRFGMTKIL